jgi:hypothetical protein
MQTAQSYFDEQGYREASEYWESDDRLTIEQATEEAAELIEADAYQIAWWLNNDSIVNADGPVNVPAASRRFQAGDELTDGELLALIFRAGEDCQQAAYTLKNRYLDHAKTKEAIKELALELMPEEETEE